MRIVFASIVMFYVLQTTCSSTNEQETRMGVNIATDMVVVFKSGTTHEDRRFFDEVTIGERIPGLDGVGLKKGIEAELALPDVCPNHDGVALKLRSNITPDQLKDIKNAVKSSSIVDEVIENVAPSKIHCRHDKINQ